jgi:hypothetical protein
MSSILRELRRQNDAPVRTATVQAAKEFSSDLADPVGCFPDQSKQLLFAVAGLAGFGSTPC